MTDNELIQALRICSSMRIIVNPNAGYVITVQDILDLINRQQAEIEEYRSKIYRQSDVVSEQKELIERIYNEAIKEFAERLKESPRKISMMSFTKERISTYVPVHAIDNLVKEMTEGKDA